MRNSSKPCPYYHTHLSDGRSHLTNWFMCARIVLAAWLSREPRAPDGRSPPSPARERRRPCARRSSRRRRTRRCPRRPACGPQRRTHARGPSTGAVLSAACPRRRARMATASSSTRPQPFETAASNGSTRGCTLLSTSAACASGNDLQLAGARASARVALASARCAFCRSSLRWYVSARWALEAAGRPILAFGVLRRPALREAAPPSEAPGSQSSVYLLGGRRARAMPWPLEVCCCWC